MPLVERFQFEHHVNPTGSLVVAHGEANVPFPIRRIYFVYGVPPHQVRGRHAHKTLTQVAVCARGSCRFLLDNGAETAEIELSTPNEGIVLRPMVWHEMSEFSEDCVLLVLASDAFDESDYIRNYEEFKRAFRAR